MDVTVRLQNEAARLLLAPLAPAEESGASRILEHLPNSLASSSRALEVLLGANLLRHSHALRNFESVLCILPRAPPSRTSSGVTGLWFVFLSSSITLGSRRRSFLQATRIIGRPGQKCMTSEIHCTIKSAKISPSEARHTCLLLNVVQRVRGVNGEADQNDMGVGVTERAETVVVLLASRIPQGELNVLSVHFDVGHIVLEHGGDINLNNGASDGGTKNSNVARCLH